MPEDESEIKCYYCQKPMGDELHYVIKIEGVVLAHRRCHDKSQAGEMSLGIIIKGGSGCAGGICKR